VGTKPRSKPKYLAAKLFAIRQRLGLSQAQLARQLKFKVSCARVSEYETGFREPNLLVLLRYSELAGVNMETLVNDKVKLPE
jgi:transcriptional regulator with XRE-family HTH domain